MLRHDCLVVSCIGALVAYLMPTLFYLATDVLLPLWFLVLACVAVMAYAVLE